MGICQGLASDTADNNATMLYAAWKGEAGDDRLFYSIFNGTSWQSQQTMPGNSSVGPALAFLDGNLYAAWKGVDGDNRLFSAMFDGTNWVHNKTIPGRSDIGPTLASLNGTLYAAWKGEDDLRLFYSVFDGNKWEPQTQFGSTEGGYVNFYSCIGPSLVVYNNMLFAAWRGAIQNFDQSIYYAFLDGSSWSVPANVPDAVSSIGPTLVPFGDSLYVFWKGEGADERVFYGWFNSEMQWQGSAQLTGVTCSTDLGLALSTFGEPEKLFAIWKVPGGDQQILCASFDGSKWAAEPNVPGNTGQDMASLPYSGLGSDSNYIMSSNCVPITELVVQIEITAELACSDGFGLQLNCHAAQGQKSAWQQYILSYDQQAGQFGCQVDNWTTESELINSGVSHFCPFPGPSIPVGTIFEISPAFDPATQKIIAANFSVTLPGRAAASGSLALHNLTTEGGRVTAGDMSPIVAFQLNFVGQDNSTTTLASGAGTITYTASPALTALPDYPPCVEYDEPTGEKANTVYGQLPPGARTSFTQTFQSAAGEGFF